MKVLESAGYRLGDNLSTAREYPDSLAVPILDANPAGLAVRRVDEHHIRKGDVSLVFHDPPLLSASSCCAQGFPRRVTNDARLRSDANSKSTLANSFLQLQAP